MLQTGVFTEAGHDIDARSILTGAPRTALVDETNEEEKQSAYERSDADH